jgi:hypothetical protein
MEFVHSQINDNSESLTEMTVLSLPTGLKPGNLRLYVILICFILQANTVYLFSQAKYYIEGKVINASSFNPVPFATVKLKINQLGVYANADGDFRIIRNSDFQNDSIIITCIGFKRQSVSYKDLSNTEVNKIYLTQAIYGLEEVKVIASRRKLGSIRIIERAIRKIKDNYPERPFSYISYYRDYQKKDGNYINLNEAIVQTIDDGFSSPSTENRYRLLDFRKNTDFQRIEISPYYNINRASDYSYTEKFIPNATLGDQNGNELFILMVHDALRNYNRWSFSFINYFSEDFILNHSFSDPVPVYNNNLLLYRIDFKTKPRVTNNYFVIASGSIYIQPKDYTIHKLAYSCFYNTGAEENKEMFNVDIEYGHENSSDSLMYLKYISFNNIFDIVDTTDKNYFRILKSYWNPSEYSKSTMVVEFNRKIDPESAIKKKNYEIIAGKKTAKIKSIQVSGYKLLIRLKDENAKKRFRKCIVSIENIKDIDGNILNHPKPVELYQYRELFVQEYNKSPQFADSCFMQYLPLEKNCISKVKGKDKYWMNTPENIKAGK